MRLIALAMILGLSACDMGHLDNLVTWPGMAVSNGLQNASYNAHRRLVKDHIATHYI